jgi:hypothetical protein
MPFGDLLQKAANGQASPAEIDQLRIAGNALNNLIGLSFLVNPTSGEITILQCGNISIGGGEIVVSVAGVERVLMDEGGLTFANTAATGYLSWNNAAGTVGSYMYKDTSNRMWLVNQDAGAPIRIAAQATSGSKNLSWLEDPALADRMQLDLGVGDAGTKLTVGGEVEIHGGVDGTTTVFNEASRDIDFRVESAANTHMLFVDAGNEAVVIGGGTPQATYELTVNNDIYAVGNVSALTFTDRTPFPKDLAEAYAAVRSIEGKDGQVDHEKLHPSIRAEGGRDLSALVSAQAAVIADLVSRIEALEAA